MQFLRNCYYYVIAIIFTVKEILKAAGCKTLSVHFDRDRRKNALYSSEKFVIEI